MYVKYSQVPPALRVAGWILLITQFFSANAYCPPPDFPEGGDYKTKKEEYEQGVRVTYSCNTGLLLFFKNNSVFTNFRYIDCKRNGKWNEPSPFCETATELKNLTTSSIADSKEFNVTDNDLKTCFRNKNHTAEFLEFPLDHKVAPYLLVVCFGEGKGMFKIAFPHYSYALNADTVKNRCTMLDTRKGYTSKNENIKIQVSTESDSFISLCEIWIYSKIEEWCEQPPENSVRKGQLEVSRSKAVLHCNEGFYEKDGKDVYATCENNEWWYMDLECIEDKSKSDDEIIACPPPDFPEGGEYEPVRTTYEVEAEIKYTCNHWPIFVDEKWIGYFMKVTCTSSGKWSDPTPICDTPAKLRVSNQTASNETDSKLYTLLDGNIHSCFRIPNGSEEFLDYSLEHKAAAFASIVCWWQGRSSVDITVTEYWHGRQNEDYGFQMVGCWMTHYPNNKQKHNVTVQISPDKGTSILLCEISIFVKDDIWCPNPPENSTRNGQLEVSHSKAILHCNEGYKEKNGEKLYATCEGNKWSYRNLQCIGLKEEPQKDYQVLAIVIGLLILIVILIMIGLSIFLIRRKRTPGIFVRFRPGGYHSHSTPPSVAG